MSALRIAALAVLDRWDSPNWKWLGYGPTADLMSALRAALAQPSQPTESNIDWQAVGQLIEAHERAKQAGCTPGTSNWGAMLWRSITQSVNKETP